jgi:hypothetical protein
MSQRVLVGALLWVVGALLALLIVIVIRFFQVLSDALDVGAEEQR